MTDLLTTGKPQQLGDWMLRLVTSRLGILHTVQPVWQCSKKALGLALSWLRSQIRAFSRVPRECEARKSDRVRVDKPLSWKQFHIQPTAQSKNPDAVKLVFKDHPRDLHKVMSIHRWSLYAGSITWNLYPWCPIKCGLYEQVVFVYRWSFEQVGPYKHSES